jgi:hypothetical protein
MSTKDSIDLMYQRAIDDYIELKKIYGKILHKTPEMKTYLALVAQLAYRNFLKKHHRKPYCRW